MHVTGREAAILLSHGVLLCTACFAHASDYYVSVTGSDDAGGTRAAPFRTLQKALDAMLPGDICIVGAGRYTSPLKMTGKLGTADQPFTFRAASGRTVVLDGTIPVSAVWNRGKQGIYQATLSQKVYQLFQNDKLVQLARWPNASFEEGSIWNMIACMRGRGEGSSLGRMVDAHPQEVDFDERGQDAVQRELTRLRVNQERLARANIDATGAIAVLNIGHWLTWARPVIEHRLGSNSFRYDTDGLDSLKRRSFPHGNYYLLGLACLDRENECSQFILPSRLAPAFKWPLSFCIQVRPVA